MEFSEGLERIGVAAFAESGIRRVDLPSSTRRIDSGAFRFCLSLQRVALNEGLETIGTDDEEACNEIGAFEGIGIKEIVLPSTLATLTKHSFRYCYSLEKVWVGQRCRARVADYVKSSVDVRVFREGDESILNGIRSNMRKNE